MSFSACFHRRIPSDESRKVHTRQNKIYTIGKSLFVCTKIDSEKTEGISSNQIFDNIVGR